jgi:hypothetical protein
MPSKGSDQISEGLPWPRPLPDAGQATLVDVNNGYRRVRRHGPRHPPLQLVEDAKA